MYAIRSYYASSAAIIGTASGLVCYGAVSLKNKLKLDDALDVWGVHGVGGLLGTILLGVFASLQLNPNGAEGLIYGNAAFFGKQVAVSFISAAYAFVFTYIMLFLRITSYNVCYTKLLREYMLIRTKMNFLGVFVIFVFILLSLFSINRITSYNVCYTKLLR